MLLRFGVENHLSIRERQEFSLVATSLKGEERGLLTTGVNAAKFALPGVVIYGANASGKSNFVKALSFVRRMVLYSHSKGDPDSSILRRPFALDNKSKSQPSRFDMDFIRDGIRYHFGFEVTDKIVATEWLYSFPSGRRQMLYERSSPTDIVFGRSLKGRNRIIADLMRDNSLFISVARQNSHDDLTSISKFFDEILLINAISVNETDLVGEFSEAKGVDERAIKFLTQINTGVVGYRSVKKKNSDKTKELLMAVSSALKAVNPEMDFGQIDIETRDLIELAHRGATGDRVFFRFDQESSGTRRLILLMSAVFKSIDRGSVIVIDEIDASLHTQVAELIIQIFFNPEINMHNAQLIATTHDTNLMRSPVLRRDQIWFAEKDEGGATSLFPLSDIHTRQGDNIEKGYLQGRFGAIPFAGSIDDILG